MSLLVLRHEPFEHLGYFEQTLQDRNIPFIYRELGETSEVPSHDGVIIMGGPQSANDPDPALAAEMRTIQMSIAAGVPLLGICLGSQLIAKALGARVYRNPVKEIGWYPVRFTDAALQDPLFAGIPNPSVFFHWHAETCDLPVGAERLAYSDRCHHQAFRYGGNVYGIQFHPEVTPEMIADWTAQPVNCGDLETLDATESHHILDPHAFDAAPFARLIFERWLVAAGY